MGEEHFSHIGHLFFLSQRKRTKKSKLSSLIWMMFQFITNKQTTKLSFLSQHLHALLFWCPTHSVHFSSLYCDLVSDFKNSPQKSMYFWQAILCMCLIWVVLGLWDIWCSKYTFKYSCGCSLHFDKLLYSPTLSLL